MRRKKNIVIISMCLAVLLMIVGYAAFQTRLIVTGTSNITGSWGIEIINMEYLTYNTSAYNIVAPSYGGTNAVVQVGLRKPGDEIAFGIFVKNTGTIDAIIEDVSITTEGSSAIIYSISDLEKGTKLAAGEMKTFTLKVQFDPNATSIPSDNTKVIDINIIAVQDEGQTITPSVPSLDQDHILTTTILNDNTAQSDSGIDFSVKSGTTNGKGLYYRNTNTQDNKTTYYFRGDVDNNYVSFAGQTWRIVRINEDGSVRLITESNVGTSKYRSTVTNSLESFHFDKSDVKGFLDNWYTNNLVNYEEYLVDAGFCADLSNPVSHNHSIGGYINYGASSRYWDSADKTPTFACQNAKEDLYTVNNSKGNGRLSHPIGLITADEAFFAGSGYMDASENYYLLDGSTHWMTMSPMYSATIDFPQVFYYFVYYGGAMALSQVNTSTLHGIRPVINLKGDVTVTSGDGTSSNPYVIDTTPQQTLVTQILSDNNEQTDTSIDFSSASSDTNGKGLYYTSTDTENNGTTYYFRGAVDNNYVSFANRTWRIVRINEDGSVRLISSNVVGNSVYNEQGQASNAYVGYMYGKPGATTYEKVHKNTNSSTIKTYLDTWYKNNLINYSKYLADSGFCNDRSLYSGNGNDSTVDPDIPASGFKTSIYRSSEIGASYDQQFKCTNKNDLFTVSNGLGNKALSYPIGLITMDELIYAGAPWSASSTNSYIYNDLSSNFWTMSPHDFSSFTYAESSIIYVMTTGVVGRGGFAHESKGVRPVINLKADVLWSSGNGTSGSPYKIKM